ncbi:MAG: acetylpolyamine amidohydrolase [Spirochaetes bacterium]|nr:acetylpolyamine amidohydrolase [Spirochaetota bacterium]
MFRIRRIFDDSLDRDKKAIVQVQAILFQQFNALNPKEIEKLPRMLKNPLKYRFRTVLFVADDYNSNVKGFALVNNEPVMKFGFLDFLSVHPKISSRGIGGALYERVREETRHLDYIGLFYECLPDDPNLCKDPAILKQNSSRLKFYEHYGAYPVINTKYETPFTPGDDCPPFLVFDPLGRDCSLSRDYAREIVQAVLERKYGKSCPPGYVKMVLESFQDDPVSIRKPRYVKKESDFSVNIVPSLEKRIALVINDRHEIHHIRERGYVEAPARIPNILEGLKKLGIFDIVPVKNFPEKFIREVHENNFVNYLKKMCDLIEPGKSVYPYVFPIRNAARPPIELPIRAGYYCIDTFTPLNKNAYIAAKRSVDCALTAAYKILEGYNMAYALVRPPGHHAERKVFGGFCYFNSAAIAANYLSKHSKVAIIDLDYHHGNGTQDIFYTRKDILTVSIHGHPKFAYPYFSGFKDEKGEGEGVGYNINYPLKEKIDGSQYRLVLEDAIQKIKKFRPDFLVITLGYDTSKGDPTGTWTLRPADFEMNGRMLGQLGLPALVVQEGGYKIPKLADNAASFFKGLWSGIADSMRYI